MTAPPVTSARGSLPSLLVIDDDGGVRDMLRRALAQDWSVGEAADSHAAWGVLGWERFDLILLDLGMKEGLGGLDILRRLKTWERTRGVPVVVFSALPEGEAALRLGAARFVSKHSFSLASLKHALAEARAVAPAPPPPYAEPPGPSVLVVEDEDGIRLPLLRELEAAGFRCRGAATHAAARAALAEDGFDALLLDQNLADGAGLSLVPFARALPGGEAAAVAFLSCNRRFCNESDWLAAGADTCWEKPLKPSRVLALLKGLMRRRPAEKAAARELAPGVELRPASRLVTAGAARSKALTAREVRLLELLADFGGLVLSQEKARVALGVKEEGASEALRQLVSRLLRKLPPAARGLVQTVHGQGWRLNRDSPVME